MEAEAPNMWMKCSTLKWLPFDERFGNVCVVHGIMRAASLAMTAVALHGILRIIIEVLYNLFEANIDPFRYPTHAAINTIALCRLPNGPQHRELQPAWQQGDLMTPWLQSALAFLQFALPPHSADKIGCCIYPHFIT